DARSGRADHDPGRRRSAGRGEVERDPEARDPDEPGRTVPRARAGRVAALLVDRDVHPDPEPGVIAAARDQPVRRPRLSGSPRPDLHRRRPGGGRDDQIALAQNLHFVASIAFASRQNGHSLVGSATSRMNNLEIQNTTRATTMNVIRLLMNAP